MSVILADTGALVALLDRRERYHDWAVDQAGEMPAPLHTCEAVLAETCFLLAGVAGALRAIRTNFASGAWKLDFSLSTEWKPVLALMESYADQPMSLGDACLVRMSELRPDSVVFTLDRDFRVYRRNRRQTIPVIIPPDL